MHSQKQYTSAPIYFHYFEIVTLQQWQNPVTGRWRNRGDVGVGLARQSSRSCVHRTGNWGILAVSPAASPARQRMSKNQTETSNDVHRVERVRHTTNWLWRKRSPTASLYSWFPCTLKLWSCPRSVTSQRFTSLFD